MRVCRFKYGHNKEVAELTDRRVCESCRMNVSPSFANATNNGEAQKHRRRCLRRAGGKEIRLGDSRLSQQTELLVWHSQLSEDAESDEDARFSTVP